METATLGKGKLFGPASFYKKALLIALPVMLQMLIQNMVSLIDNFMVSGLGDVKMSGVNISGQIHGAAQYDLHRGRHLHVAVLRRGR